MRKISLVLVISASFVAGTLVTGNFVFADPADGQNNLLGMILNKLNGTVDDAVFVWGDVTVQSYICPNSDESSAIFQPTLFIHSESFESLGPSLEITNNDQNLFTNVEFANGDITTDNFILKGILFLEEFCGGLTTPSGVTLSGDCGLGETATLTSEEGLSVTFSGNIVCT